MDQRTIIFQQLLEEVDRLLKDDTTTDEIIVAKTAKGNIYHCKDNCYSTWNGENYDFSDEEHFLQMLREKDDTQVQFLVAVMNPHMGHAVVDESMPYCLSMISGYLLEGLPALNPKNLDMYILFVGEGHYNAKKLRDCMPPKKD